MADIAAIVSIVGLTLLYILEIWVNIGNQRRLVNLEIACYYLACQMGKRGLLAEDDPLQIITGAKAGSESGKANTDVTD